MKKATATAHPNIALVKYWGKRDEALILPHQSSLSVTLAPLSVTTSVEWGTAADEVSINDEPAKGSELKRVIAMLDLVRGGHGFARVVSHGNFPKAAGLASSAAGFAALAVAARAAAGLPRDVKAESVLARQGSGSACRSIQGGVCVWHKGSRADGADSFATQELTERHWPELRLLVAMVSREEKEVKSRDGMRSAVETSPYYAEWTRDAEAEVPRALAALRAKDLRAIGEIAEKNAWRMHATSLAADPPLCYLKPQTLEVISTLAGLRRDGVPAYFTLDAGPNPVVLTDAAHEATVEAALKKLGASSIVRCHPGGDATVS
ncbi:MAG: diphosphomevalonate decarboxylase [Archangiaceae bacterium]|nr:diphosphomevalonate decarboxylase [Archangiaceae bacterium]